MFLDRVLIYWIPCQIQNSSFAWQLLEFLHQMSQQCIASSCADSVSFPAVGVLLLLEQFPCQMNQLFFSLVFEALGVLSTLDSGGMYVF